MTSPCRRAGKGRHLRFTAELCEPQTKPALKFMASSDTCYLRKSLSSPQGGNHHVVYFKSNPNIPFLNRNTLVAVSGPFSRSSCPGAAFHLSCCFPAVNAALCLLELSDRNQDMQIRAVDLNYEQQVSVQESSGEGAPRALPLVVQREGCKVPINYPR